MWSSCDFIDHAGPIVGFSQRVQPTGKKNLPQRPLLGLYVLRRCARCGEIYSPGGNAEMLGVNKHPVRMHDTMFFIDGCANGCPPAELFIKEREQEAPAVVIGCNFCFTNVEEPTVARAIDAWTEKQGNHQ